MQDYEVTIPLTDSGRNLHVLVASPSAEEAEAEARRTLHAIGVKAGREYDAGDVRVEACTVRPA